MQDNLIIALIAFIVDYIFGEFRGVKHPVVFMGEFINQFEKKFYRDSISRGATLTISLIFITVAVIYPLESFFKSFGFIGDIFLGVVASMAVANRMLFESVKDVLQNPQNIRFLVSRDTQNLSDSEINRASIETYAENLSDGVVAPLFFMLLFGVTGAFVYKAINTLDSMVGYRNRKYENFGKFSAKLDDIANFIPARVTAILIGVLFFSRESLKKLWRYGRLHKSPNAGYPISAMALALGLKLGGDTFYFGKLQKKPFFGEGRVQISQKDVTESLTIFNKFSFFLLLALFFANIFVCS